MDIDRYVDRWIDIDIEGWGETRRATSAFHFFSFSLAASIASFAPSSAVRALPDQSERECSERGGERNRERERETRSLSLSLSLSPSLSLPHTHPQLSPCPRRVMTRRTSTILKLTVWGYGTNSSVLEVHVEPVGRGNLQYYS